MKIAVLGKNGFIGTSVVAHLEHKHEVTGIGRDDLDLHNFIEVSDWLNQNKFDVVINCAITGGTQTVHGKIYDDAISNINMFMNFFNNYPNFGRYINIGSGAEFDLKSEIMDAKEPEIFYRTPVDSYGWSKNVIAKMCSEQRKFFTLRLFGCFGANEKEFRLFKRILANPDFLLEADRYFDYISIQDFLKIIDVVIGNEHPGFQDINCVYTEKMLLSNIIREFYRVKGLDVERFKMRNECMRSYTGDADRVNSLNIQFDGLTKGFENYE